MSGRNWLLRIYRKYHGALLPHKSVDQSGEFQPVCRMQISIINLFILAGGGAPAVCSNIALVLAITEYWPELMSSVLGAME